MYILTRDFLMDSSPLLKDAIESISDHEVTITTDVWDLYSTPNPKFIRFGNSDWYSEGDTNHNSARFIQMVADKRTFADIMQMTGVYSPRFTLDLPPRDSDYPVMVRTKMCSYGGKGIVICKNYEEYKPYLHKHYWTPFLKITKEYRVHVLGGEVVKIFRKIGGEGIEFPIRNQENGYHFSIRTTKKYPKIVKLVNEIQPALKGSMYTLDIGWDSKTKQYFLFEANSASGLNKKTAMMYAEYIVKCFDTENS